MRERASERARPGRRRARRAPGRGARLSRARLASPLRAGTAVSACGSPAHGGPGRARRAAESPASCHSAAGRHKRRQRRRGERRDSGLACSPAPRGAKLRPAAAEGLPSSGGSRRRAPGIWARGVPGHRRAGGGALSSPVPTRNSGRRPEHPGTPARGLAPAPWDPATRGKTRTRKHVHSLRRWPWLRSPLPRGGGLGGFLEWIYQPF